MEVDPADGSDFALLLAAWVESLGDQVQDDEIGRISGRAVAAPIDVLKLLRFGHLQDHVFVSGDAEILRDQQVLRRVDTLNLYDGGSQLLRLLRSRSGLPRRAGLCQ